MSTIRLGIDLGRENDSTALAAVQPMAGQFEIRQLGRLPLGMRFPDQAQVILKAVTALVQHGPVLVVIDATGVGAPVVDMIFGPLRELCMLKPVEFAAGDIMQPVIKATGDRYWRVGKAFLVSRLKALLQDGRIVGSARALGPEFEALQAEVLAYEMRSSGTHDFYGAKPGKHDDMISALALSVLDEEPGEIEEFRQMNDMLANPNEMSTVREEIAGDAVARMGGDFTKWHW